MYVAGYGIRPLRASRRGALAATGRVVAVIAAAIILGAGFAVVAQGGSPPRDATVVVQPGDTLWSIAAARYPGDDVRSRVAEIESLNGLKNPVIVAGETLQLPS